MGGSILVGVGGVRVISGATCGADSAVLFDLVTLEDVGIDFCSKGAGP